MSIQRTGWSSDVDDDLDAAHAAVGVEETSVLLHPRTLSGGEAGPPVSDVTGDVAVVGLVLVPDEGHDAGGAALAAVHLDGDLDTVDGRAVEAEGVRGEPLHGGDDGVGVGVLFGRVHGVIFR